MTLKDRIEAFSELGHVLRTSIDDSQSAYGRELGRVISSQQYKNPWFTPENVKMAIREIADELTYENLIEWTGKYPELDTYKDPKNIGAVMAGNIPLAGFHDFLSILITGHNLIAKTSSKDPELIVILNEILTRINPGFRKKVRFSDGPISGFDAVIATGSDNSSRYFEYYFGKYPHIIRKNRNSIAIIEGDETVDELKKFGSDVFSYFGLGCRSVSKVYLPEGYNLSKLPDNWQHYRYLINHNKYANNYDFHKAVYLVNNEKFVDSGFVLLKESEQISSPVAVLYFEYYNSINNVLRKIENHKDKIQCIVSKRDVKFGSAQSPHLWDYADGTDTIEFLLKKNWAGIS